jgi:hypothetical protein
MEKVNMRKAVMLLTVFVLAFGFVQPAAADDFDLLIHNNTEEDIKLILDGPEHYSFTVEPGKHEKAVEEGTYEYKYEACGGLEFNGTVTVTEEGVWLILEQCPPPTFTAKFVVYSHFGETMVLSMTGPEDYELTLNLGKNKFVDIVAGEYFYSYDACDSTISGTVRVTKNGKAQLTLKSCETQALLAYGLPNPSNLRIGNHYAFPLSMSFSGPANYRFELAPGYNRIDVIRGTYSYVYTAYGKTYTGSIDVSGPTTWVVFSPTPLKP